MRTDFFLYSLDRPACYNSERTRHDMDSVSFPQARRDPFLTIRASFLKFGCSMTVLIVH